jgi:SIR2-like domain
MTLSPRRKRSTAPQPDVKGKSRLHAAHAHAASKEALANSVSTGHRHHTMRLAERDWTTLLTRIKNGECTPFLGAAVNFGFLPLGKDIAKEWADAEDYPLETCVKCSASRSDLAKVSQFVAIHNDAIRPKELMLEKLNKPLKPFDFNDPDEPLNVLARLPFSIYLTTNYDDLLTQAINHHGRAAGREAAVETCKWNSILKSKPTVFGRGSKFDPSVKTPLVYHLHGHCNDKNSLVLTEDDYLDFLVNMSQTNNFLPPRIQEAIAACSVIFVGYSLADINFRVLFRGLLGNIEQALGRLSVAVQLPYEDSNPNKDAAEQYVTDYFSKLTKNREIKVYWGDAKDFARELWQRWSEFNGSNP